MNFQKWLESNSSKIEGGEDLVKEMTSFKITFSPEIKKLEDLESVIEKSDADDDLKASLKERIKKLWTEFHKEYPTNNVHPLLSKLSSLVPMAGIIIIAGLILLVVYKAFFGENEFLNILSSIEFTRGLITFLFALGTIGIALIITISVFTSQRPLNESKERFYRGKEILTLLIGILGTIVGFYFGSPTDSEKQIEPIELSELVMSTSQPVIGEPFTITTLVKGGVPPYTYTMLLKDGMVTIEEVKDKDSQDGLITNTFKIEEGNEEYNITTKLIVEDARGQSATLVAESIEVKKKE